MRIEAGVTRPGRPWPGGWALGGLLLMLLLLPLLSGCFYSREITRLKQDLEQAYPEARFERRFVLRVGTGAFRTIGGLLRRVPDDEVADLGESLEDVRRVKVGVYEVEAPTGAPVRAFPLSTRFREEGWEVAVRVREDDEATWILYRERRGTVRDVCVLVLDASDLVILRFEGHLQALLERVLAEDAGRAPDRADG